MTDPDQPDDRAERAFRDGLRQHADEPDFEPLKLDPGKTSRRRWPRWLPIAAAIVLVAAVAVPLVLNLRTTGGITAAAPAEADATADRGSSAAPTPGWRWESYRVLSYQVPTSWGYDWAPTTDWCTGRPVSSQYGAFVDIAPETRAVAMILCPRDIPAEQLRMFVSVRAVDAPDRGWDLPSGWKVASTDLAGYRLEVVHPDDEARVAQEVVASVRPLGDVDANGCSAVSTIRTKEQPGRQPAITDPDRVSLCQFDLAKEPGLLASKPLTGSEATQVTKALASAPRGSGPDESCRATGDTAVLARLWQGTAVQDVFVRYSGCTGNGIFDGTGSRELTGEACHAVMIPPLVFTTGHGEAATMCAPAPTPSASPSGTPTR